MAREPSDGRYRHKDYLEVVSFPVEIVAHDGSVRRFPFEDAVAMYQRRVDYAGERFSDPEDAERERLHCSRRVQQLRDSYFQRFGWAGAQASRAGESPDFGPHCGEVAAFLRRVLGVEGRLEVAFGEPEGWARSFEVKGRSPGFKVYYVPGAREAEERTHTLELLQALGGNVSAGEQQRDHLLSLHQGPEFLVGLTGTWQHVKALASQEYRADRYEVRSVEHSPWDAMWEGMRTGDFPRALEDCAGFKEAHPWHVPARATGVLISVYLEDWARVESFYPDEGSGLWQDGDLRWARAVASLLSGGVAEDLPEGLEPRWPAESSLRLLNQVRGAWWSGWGERLDPALPWAVEHRVLRAAVALSHGAMLIFCAAVLKASSWEAWVGGAVLFSGLGLYASRLWVRQASERLSHSVLVNAVPVMLRRLARLGLPTVYATSETDG